MKNLIVYYSLEGDTKFLAETIAKEIDCDIMELKPKKEYPKGSFLKYFFGGKSVMRKEKPELINSYKDISQYENIFIGSPVWCSTYTPPISTFIEKYKDDITGKKIALFACHKGGGAEKLFDNLRNELNNSECIGSIDIVQPLSKDKIEVRAAIKKWISDIKVR